MKENKQDTVKEIDLLWKNCGPRRTCLDGYRCQAAPPPTCDSSTNCSRNEAESSPFVWPPIFSFFLHFTSCVSSHLTRSCTKHLAPLLSPPLRVFASSISAHSHNCSLSRTHTSCVCGFEAAMTQSRFFKLPIAGKCFVQSYFPPDFPCLVALIHMARGACVNSLVFQLEGPADPQGVTHCSVTARAA